MKTIFLKVEDSSYQIILDFIKLLPKNRCTVLEMDDMLSREENIHIQHCLAQIEQGDYSDFDDFEMIKHQ